MTPRPETLSNILKAARKNAGITLADLADAMDVSENTLKRTLDAPEKAPFHRLDRMCKLLNIGIRMELGNV